MTKGLHRDYGTRNLHFTICTGYRCQPHLRTARRRDLFLTLLEETRRKYRFVVHGYVLMPEHFHLLITEPEVGDPSVVMKVIKQRFARQVKRKCRRSSSAQGWLWDITPVSVWQKRFYDFGSWNCWRSWGSSAGWVIQHCIDPVASMPTTTGSARAA